MRRRTTGRWRSTALGWRRWDRRSGGSTTAKDVTTRGDIAFNDDVTLNGTYDSSANNGTFKAAKSATLAGNVTVSTGTGNAEFAGAVNADAAANDRALAINSAGVTTLGSPVGGSQARGGLGTGAAGSATGKDVTTR